MFGFLTGLSSTITGVGGAVLGAVLMFAIWSIVDPIDDARVARAARQEYVRVSEFEAEVKKREAAEALARLRAGRLAEMQRAARAAEEAAARFAAEREATELTLQEKNDEIARLRAARPDGLHVPTLGDLGIFDELRQR